MKLTNYIRDAFIHAAMQDVPTINYRELIQKRVLHEAIAALPASVAKLYKDENTRPFLKLEYYYFGNIGTLIPCSDRQSSKHSSFFDVVQINKLLGLDKEQSKKLQELRTKLHVAAYSCSTRKQLLDLLPEFEKYLPADEAKAMKINLPTVANIVGDFVKAGWPKNQAKSANALL